MKPKALLVQPIEVGSEKWRQTLVLRNKVLRHPLGLELTAEELESQRDSFHFAAYREDVDLPQATLLLTPRENGAMQMRQVAVATAQQGSGVGRALVRHAEDFARQNEFTKMVLDARASALGFYEALGYETCSEPFIEHTIPHVKMEKVL